MFRRCVVMSCAGGNGAAAAADALFTQQQRADYNAKLWGGAAGEYERSYGRKMAAYAAAALRLGAEGRDSSHFGDVLDVGCGAGAVWDALVENDHRCSSFTGVDYAPEMIATAAQKIGSTHADATARVSASVPPRLEVMDGQALTFPDASFDTTTAMFSVLFFEDKARGLLEMARVTRPGGTGLVATWSKIPDMEWVYYGGQALVQVLGARVPRAKSGTGDRLSFQVYSEPAVLAEAMRTSGWSAAEVTPVTFEFPFASAGELEQLYHDMSYAYPTLRWVIDTFPEDERADIRRDVAAAFAAVVHAKTGTDDAYGVLRGVANIAKATK